jgi:hypothetical protein
MSPSDASEERSCSRAFLPRNVSSATREAAVFGRAARVVGVRLLRGVMSGQTTLGQFVPRATKMPPRRLLMLAKGLK